MPPERTPGDPSAFLTAYDIPYQGSTSVGEQLESGGATNVYVQDSDPGAVGAGKLWVDTTTPGTSDQHVWRRNAADDGWEDLLANWTSPTVISLATADDGGSAGGNILVTSADSEGGGSTRFAGGDNPAVGAGAVLEARGANSDTGSAGFARILAGSAGFGTNADGGDFELTAGFGDGDGSHGTIRITTGGSTGTAGQVLTAQGDDTALWETILTVQTGAPDTYTTPLVYDDTAMTGGLYAWVADAYVQIGALV